jgi:hypothetical protein
MAISNESQTKMKATAAIQAELDRINRNFSRSLRMCNEAAGLLMVRAGQQFNETQHSKAETNLIGLCAPFYACGPRPGLPFTYPGVKVDEFARLRRTPAAPA